MYGCESWAPKNWCLWTVVLEKTFESALDSNEIKPINLKGNQSWIVIGSTDAEAEVSIFWPSDAKNWLNGKDPDAGKDWRQEEKGKTEDEMAGRHHRLNRHEFEQAPGVMKDREAWRAAIHGVTEWNSTEWLSWTDWSVDQSESESPKGCRKWVFAHLKTYPIGYPQKRSERALKNIHCGAERRRKSRSAGEAESMLSPGHLWKPGNWGKGAEANSKPREKLEWQL